MPSSGGHAASRTPTGLTSFAPAAEARRSLFSARRRLRLAGDGDGAPAVSKQEFYG
jgi:hypothetical protein